MRVDCAIERETESDGGYLKQLVASALAQTLVPASQAVASNCGVNVAVQSAKDRLRCGISVSNAFSAFRTISFHGHVSKRGRLVARSILISMSLKYGFSASLAPSNIHTAGAARGCVPTHCHSRPFHTTAVVTT